MKGQGPFRHCWSGSLWLYSLFQDRVRLGSALLPQEAV